ncbi:calcium-binding protein, partial [uncultured Ruminococcus sp.]|uniref:calcium-binding protein n=1 Tax=uncultured Ruminococcus sp. TaxID=165186 RepID=UPI0025E27C07
QFYWDNYQIESFEFADGTIAHIDLNKSEFVIDVEGTPVIVEQTTAEYLSDLYAEEMFSGELTADDTVIAEITDSISIGDESDEISDLANIQAMILAENMSAFSNDSQISDGIKIGDITADSSALDQLLINSSMQ